MGNPMRYPMGYPMGFSMGYPMGNFMGNSMQYPMGNTMGYPTGYPMGYPMGYPSLEAPCPQLLGPLCASLLSTCIQCTYTICDTTVVPLKGLTGLTCLSDRFTRDVPLSCRVGNKQTEAVQTPNGRYIGNIDIHRDI